MHRVFWRQIWRVWGWAGCKARREESEGLGGLGVVDQGELALVQEVCKRVCVGCMHGYVSRCRQGGCANGEPEENESCFNKLLLNSWLGISKRKGGGN